jgi:S-formylglutathione hydrolase FrmB
MPPWPSPLVGRLDEQTITSTALRGNPLGDPSERPVLVYLPPGYDPDGDRRYPSIYVLHGYFATVSSWTNRSPWRGSVPELVDTMFTGKRVPPTIVVFVDGWTAYGGSQYVDSAGTGDYATYLCDEIVPWVDAAYRTVPHRDHRAVTGRSSGGYGAMVAAMRRPDLFGALATHAGDALFDVCFRATFPRLARTLRDEYGGDWATFLDVFQHRIDDGTVGNRESDPGLMLAYGCAAAFSPGPDGTPQVPFDGHGDVRADVWDRWLAVDPVLMARRPEHAAALRSLHGIWIDAGRRDEYFLDLGAEAFRSAVAAAGVPDDRVRYELFDARHGGIDFRYPPALAWLCHRIDAVPAVRA